MRRLAASVARRATAATSIEDLVSAGLLALVDMQRRNPHLQVEDLERMATARARGAMLDELRGADPLARRARKRVQAVERAAAAFERQHGRVATDRELGACLGMDESRVAEARELARLGRPGAVESLEAQDIPARAEQEEQVHRRERLSRFARAVASLPGRHRSVVEMYFGDDRTLRQVGEELGVTEARASQILSAAVKQLRTACASLPPPAA